jgi:glycosyltransferase involved in cell wall biosynthesis
VSEFVAYDVTRLLMRYAVPTPNGIDRVDLAYARHFTAAPNSASTGAFLHGLQPALLENSRLMPFLAEMQTNWLDGNTASAPTFEDVKDRLLGNGSSRSDHRGTSAQRHNNAGSFAHRLKPLGIVLEPRSFIRALFGRLPPGAVFIHATHYPFEHLFRWLESRRDVKAVFFIHDLLPLQFPEYFEPRHVDWHRRALDIFVRYGSAAIVNTHFVGGQVLNFLHSRGRHDVPVLVHPIPPDPAFSTAHQADPGIAEIPYFVTCGTIEPRKNQLMLLQVWRELARQWGGRTPKLVLIGARGWKNENVIDLLDRSLDIRKHVIEVTGLPTTAMARLIAGARALLMPSFGEGYGLPIIEARALGTPVIASDIPVFREIAPEVVFRSPIDAASWLDAVQDYAERKDRGPVAPGTAYDGDAFVDYYGHVERFLYAL